MVDSDSKPFSIERCRELLGAECSGLSDEEIEAVLGDVHVGEGVLGLRRTVALAGARTLVMSLWKVPDDETAALMTAFYTGLKARRPRAEALREAQLAIRAHHSHPWYWGAFICQGDPGPMRLA